MRGLASKTLKAALVGWTLCALAVAITPVQAATVTYDFTLSFNGTSGVFPVTGSGIIIANAGAGGQAIQEISLNGSSFEAPTSYAGADNLLFYNTNGTSLLDSNGLSFVDGSQSINLWGFNSPGTSQATGNAYAETISGIGFAGVGTFTMTIAAAVPEPSTWAMMIIGFCGLGFMAYRRKQNGSALSAA
jgi:hypothetical protein